MCKSKNVSRMLSKHRLVALLLALASVGFLFAACDKEKKKEEQQYRLYIQSRPTNVAGDSADWVYFSFAKGGEVEGVNGENRQQRLDWDLAFNRMVIRTNSGTSGSGKGGALSTGSGELNEVTEAPTDGYTVDTEVTLSGYSAASGQVSFQVPGNTVLSGAIKFSGPPPTYEPSNMVYVVRTADGKYAKILIESFHNAEGKSGYINMKYSYQPDGGRKF